MIYTNEEYLYLTRKGIDPNAFRKTYEYIKKTFGSDALITSAEKKESKPAKKKKED